MDVKKLIDGKYEYFAFISYKREDEEWAKWLQHKLEHYHLPMNIRNENDNLPPNIRPVFKDTSELSAGVLAEEIHEALEKSKYLIVICSPRAAQSQWVGKEVQSFIDMGRTKQIIPFIIGGTAFAQDPSEECFPSALLNLPKEQELLGVNINEMGRDAAAVKVVARMFDLKFDTLWQRWEREQRRKRWMIIGGVLLFALMSLGVGAWIAQKNVELDKANKRLKEESITYSQLQEDRKQYYFAGQLQGFCYGGTSIAVFHPNEAIVVFSDNYGIWLHYLNSNVEVQLTTLETEGPTREVGDLCFSNDGTEVMAKGLDAIYIWNVESCKLIDSYFGEDADVFLTSTNFKLKFSNYNESKINRYSSHKLRNIRFLRENGKLIIYNSEDNREICSTDFVYNNDSTLRYICNEPYKEVLFMTDQRAALYDEIRKDFVLFFKGYEYVDDIEFNDYGEYLRIGNLIYARTVKIDTIKHLQYSVHDIKGYPNLVIRNKTQYDDATKSSLTISDNTILYKRGNHEQRINVDVLWSGGNGSESITDAIFAGQNKVVAIMDQGNLRVYNINTGALMGTLENYEWDNTDKNLGHERDLCHAESYIVGAEFINGRLYVLSSGGVLRIYNTSKMRLEKVIVLPIEAKEGEGVGSLDKFHLSDSATQIIYSFKNHPFYYICKLPQDIPQTKRNQ